MCACLCVHMHKRLLCVCTRMLCGLGEEKKEAYLCDVCCELDVDGRSSWMSMRRSSSHIIATAAERYVDVMFLIAYRFKCAYFQHEEFIICVSISPSILHDLVCKCTLDKICSIHIIWPPTAIRPKNIHTINNICLQYKTLLGRIFPNPYHREFRNRMVNFATVCPRNALAQNKLQTLFCVRRGSQNQICSDLFRLVEICSAVLQKSIILKIICICIALSPVLETLSISYYTLGEWNRHGYFLYFLMFELALSNDTSVYVT